MCRLVTGDIEDIRWRSSISTGTWGHGDGGNIVIEADSTQSV